MQTQTFAPKQLLYRSRASLSQASPAISIIEEDLAHWLLPREFLGAIMPPQSIEETRTMYLALRDAPPDLSSSWRIRRAIARISDRPCEHGIVTRLEICAACRAPYQLRIDYLDDLLPRAKAFYRSRAYWEALDPYEFEHQVAAVLRRIGWGATVTSGSCDDGVDIVADTPNGRAVVQCKHYSKPVGPGPIRELVGVRTHFNAKLGMLVCSSGFTEGARRFGEEHELILVDMEGLLALQLRGDNQAT